MIKRLHLAGFLILVALAVLFALPFSPTLAADRPATGDDAGALQEDQPTPDVLPPDSVPNRGGEIVPEAERLEEPSELAPDSSIQAASRYVFISANTFTAYDSTTAHSYYSAGCIYHTGGSAWMEHSLELPDGAVVDQLRFYYFDNDPTNNASLYFAAYNGAGATSTIATVNSAGAFNGYSFTDSAVFSRVVDNSAEALSLSINFNAATTNTLRICGVRVRYQYSPSAVFLPVINR